MLLFSSPLFSLLVFFETLLSSSSWIVLRAFFRSLHLVHEFSFVYRRVGGRRILELGAVFQSSSLFGQPVVRGATFLHQHLSVRIILIESLVAAVIPQVFQRPSQCASIGSLSLVAPTAILIKLFFLLSLSVCWVRVWVCGSLFSFSLCSLLLYRLSLRGTLGPISYSTPVIFVPITRSPHAGFTTRKRTKKRWSIVAIIGEKMLTSDSPSSSDLSSEESEPDRHQGSSSHAKPSCLFRGVTGHICGGCATDSERRIFGRIAQISWQNFAE